MKHPEISKYQEFVDVLNVGLQNYPNISASEWKEKATKYVDGFASDELRRLVDISTRKEFGIFFTNSLLAKSIFDLLKPYADEHSVFYDPTCGAGNLIIAAFNFVRENNIPINKDEQFLGTDIHTEFIEAARLRCLMNTVLQEEECAASVFNFSQSNGLEPNEFYNRATHIIVNPPFNLMLPGEKLSWSNGKVSSAALFMDKIIQHVNPGTSIYAILPDVLRSGSRYEKWRKVIQESCIIGKTKLLGQFDKFADVDVFGFELTKRKKSIVINASGKIKVNADTQKTVSDLFEICVGPVVDNRDPHSGNNLGYIVSKGLKGWTVQTEALLNRAHGGKSFSAPFVVVKRTSRMGDSQRAIATIVDIKEPVFVDNHLIILQPKSGNLKDCLDLLSVLKNPKTDEWLNNRIRCRHLTVRIVSKIPIWQ